MLALKSKHSLKREQAKNEIIMIFEYVVFSILFIDRNHNQTRTK